MSESQRFSEVLGGAEMEYAAEYWKAFKEIGTLAQNVLSQCDIIGNSMMMT